VDLPGALLLSAGLVCGLVALTEGEHWGWTSARTLGLAAACVVLLAAWTLVELRVPEPMVDMRMMAERPVLLTNVATLIAGYAMFSTFVLVPIFVATPESAGYGFGATATQAGLFLLPSSIAMLFAGPLAGVLGRMFGSKWPLSIGMGLVAVTAAGLAAYHDEPWHIVVAMVGLGAGVSFSFAAMAALITESVRPTETGIATGMNTVMRTVGGVVGGQVGAALLTAYAVGASGVASEDAYEIAFVLSAAAAAVACVVSLFITAPVRSRRRLEAAEAALD
jgi:MFS family permease